MLQATTNQDPAARLASGSQALVLSEQATLSGKKSLLFEYLTPQERDYVIAKGQPRLAKRHATIFRQGDVQKGIYIINSGAVRVFYASPSGREITRAYWFAGNFIGGPDVFAQNRNMWTAVAIRDASLLLIPSETLRALCLRMPNLAIGLIEAMVFKGRCYSAMTQMLGTRTAGERMLRVLLMLTEMYGKRSGDDIVIDVPITHEEIAHMVGATRQWVTIGLKKLQAERIIDARRGSLRIHDLKALNDRAGPT